MLNERRFDERRLDELYMEMIHYYAGDAKRIQHFVKVHSFAKLIGKMEHLDEETLTLLEAAAYVHDIGIRSAEEKYGSCEGKLQEKEGPPVARAMLEGLGCPEKMIDRVCYLVGEYSGLFSITSPAIGNHRSG